MLAHENPVTSLNASHVIYIELTAHGRQRLIEALMSDSGAPYAAVAEHINANYNIGGSTLRFELLKFIQLFGSLVGPTSFDPRSRDCLFESVQLVSTI